jgi:hypothetical protein
LCHGFRHEIFALARRFVARGFVAVGHASFTARRVSR